MLSGEPHEKKRIESLGDIRTFLVRLNYALNSGRVRIVFQKKREVDDKRNERFTNRYTIHYLFPGEDEIKVLKREHSRLRHYDYIETVQDTNFHERSEMRVFVRKYSGEDVYIKIRVELLNVNGVGGMDYIFVMSFHFAERPFKESDFPYRQG